MNVIGKQIEEDNKQVQTFVEHKLLSIPIGVQKPGPSYSPAIYTIDIAYKIDIPL